MIPRIYQALKTFTRNGRTFEAGKDLPVHAGTWADLREKQRQGLVSGGPAERAANAKAQRDALTQPVDAVAPKATKKKAPPPAKAAAVAVSTKPRRPRGKAAA